MDLYCKRCSLQFDKKVIFNTHLSIVHKEQLDIKEEPTDSISKKQPDETRKTTTIRCETCGKTFSQMEDMNKHIV